MAGVLAFGLLLLATGAVPVVVAFVQQARLRPRLEAAELEISRLEYVLKRYESLRWMERRLDDLRASNAWKERTLAGEVLPSPRRRPEIEELLPPLKAPPREGHPLRLRNAVESQEAWLGQAEGWLRAWGRLERRLPEVEARAGAAEWALRPTEDESARLDALLHARASTPRVAATGERAGRAARRPPALRAGAVSGTDCRSCETRPATGGGCEPPRRGPSSKRADRMQSRFPTQAVAEERMRRYRMGGVGLASVLIASLMGCLDDADDATGPGGATVGATVHVRGPGLGYSMDSVTITAGQAVEWIWDTGGHTVTSCAIVGGLPACTPDGSYDSGALAVGATFQHLFTTPGLYGYSAPPAPTAPPRSRARSCR